MIAARPHKFDIAANEGFRDVFAIDTLPIQAQLVQMPVVGVVSVAGKFCRFLFEMALDGLVKILHEMSFVENNQRIIPSF